MQNCLDEKEADTIQVSIVGYSPLELVCFVI